MVGSFFPHVVEPFGATFEIFPHISSEYDHFVCIHSKVLRFCLFGPGFGVYQNYVQASKGLGAMPYAVK